MRPRENISKAPESAPASQRGFSPGSGNALQTTEIFRSLIDNFPDAILVVDPGFQILIHNEKAKLLFGTESPAGRSVFAFLEMDHPERLQQAADKSIEEGSARLECLILCPNGV